MTRDDVIRMALEAGLGPDWAIVNCHDQLASFAALVAQQEREACAKVCYQYAMALDHARVPYVRNMDCHRAAKAIRARGAK